MRPKGRRRCGGQQFPRGGRGGDLHPSAPPPSPTCKRPARAPVSRLADASRSRSPLAGPGPNAAMQHPAAKRPRIPTRIENGAPALPAHPQYHCGPGAQRVLAHPAEHRLPCVRIALDGPNNPKPIHSSILGEKQRSPTPRHEHHPTHRAFRQSQQHVSEQHRPLRLVAFRQVQHAIMCSHVLGGKAARGESSAD